MLIRRLIFHRKDERYLGRSMVVGLKVRVGKFSLF
jgi:hypothetical protein